MSVRSSNAPNPVSAAVDKPIIELGKKLVLELGLVDAVDTLGRWMAHHIAELMAEADAANSSERSIKEARCRTAILELWNHRHALADRAGQFESDRLLRAIASLDPEVPGHRYFAQLRQNAERSDDSASSWIELANRIDDTARMLIVQCLIAAAADARDKSQEWIALAEAAQIEDDAPMAVIRFLNDESDLQAGVKLEDADREALRKRVNRLKAFTKLATILRSHLMARLGADYKSNGQAAKRSGEPKFKKGGTAREKRAATPRKKPAKRTKKAS
jgi:hypothetical protein